MFRQLFDTTSCTYSYLLASRKGGEALIIDPVLEQVDRYIELLEELELELVKAVDTHLHADHATGLGALRDRSVVCMLHLRIMKPQDDAIAVRQSRWVSEMRVLVRVPVMKLEHQFLSSHELLVLRSAVPAREAEHALVPLASRQDVVNGDQWLRLHDAI